MEELKHQQKHKKLFGGMLGAITLCSFGVVRIWD